MSREKLAEQFLERSSNLLNHIYEGTLADQITSEQRGVLVAEVLKGGFKEAYMEVSNLLLTDNDAEEIYNFNVKYQEKTKAMETLLAAKTEEMQSNIDFVDIIDKLGLFEE